jgi:phosphoserine phosphatase RsbU/P
LFCRRVTVSTLPISDITELCASVRELFDAESCVCAVVESGAEHLEFVAGDGAGVDALVGQRLRVGEGITGYIAQAGVPVEVHPVRDDERRLPGFPANVDYVPEVLLGVPLSDESGRVVGVLSVLDPADEVVAEARAAGGGMLPALTIVAAELALMLG